jgi:hypothetical protein
VKNAPAPFKGREWQYCELANSSSRNLEKLKLKCITPIHAIRLKLKYNHNNCICQSPLTPGILVGVIPNYNIALWKKDG